MHLGKKRKMSKAGEKEEMSIKNDSQAGELFHTVKKLRKLFFFGDWRQEKCLDYSKWSISGEAKYWIQKKSLKWYNGIKKNPKMTQERDIEVTKIG